MNDTAASGLDFRRCLDCSRFDSLVKPHRDFDSGRELAAPENRGHGSAHRGVNQSEADRSVQKPDRGKMLVLDLQRQNRPAPGNFLDLPAQEFLKGEGGKGLQIWLRTCIITRFSTLLGTSMAYSYEITKCRLEVLTTRGYAMTKRTIQWLLVALVLTGCQSSTYEVVEGSVIDARTGNPLIGVSVTAGSRKAVTDSDGNFLLRDVDKQASVVALAPNYSSATMKAGETKLRLKLAPIPVTGTVVSNLTGQGLQATLFAATETFQSELDGTFTVYGVGPGDSLKVTATGYEEAMVTVSNARQAAITLLADPAATMQKIAVDWEKERNYDKLWEWMHPDVANWMTKEQMVKEYERSLNEGYSTISIEINEVTIGTWTFPKCTYAKFGPKTYPNTATVRGVWHVAEPVGESSDETRAAHLVRTDDGRWCWFLATGCGVPKSS